MTLFSWFGCGLMVGVSTIAVAPELPSLPLLMVAAGVCARAVIHKRWFLAGFVFGVLWASLWGHHLLTQRLPASCAGQWFVIEGQVTSLVRHRAGHLPAQYFEFQVSRFLSGDESCHRPRQLWLVAYAQQDFSAGTSWRLQARLKPPRGLNNPGGYNRLLWFSSRGIDATGSVKQRTAVPLLLASSLPGTVAALREHIRHTVLEVVKDADSAALLIALAVGDDSELSNDMQQALRALGVSHLVVISGLHIGLAAGFGFLLGKLFSLVGLGSGRTMGLLLSLVLASCYAVLAGMALPCLRALIMLYVAVGYLLRDEPAPLWMPFLMALAIVLLTQPLSPLNAGLWLSFGAVAALLALARRYRQLPSWGLALVMQGFLTIIMSVLSLVFFGGLSALMFVSNVILVPLVSLFVVPTVLVAALASLANSALSLWLWNVLGQLLRGVINTLVSVKETVPSPWIEITPTPVALTLALGACVLVLFPAIKRIWFIALVLLMPVILPRHSDTPAGAVDIWVFDVGQGTAVVIHSLEHTLMYDTGGGHSDRTMAESVVLPALQYLGISDIDTLVVSHGDSDHSAGAALINARYPAIDSYSSDPEFGNSDCTTTTRFHWHVGNDKSVTARFLAPFSKRDAQLSNDTSCVLQVQVGHRRVLLPGDIEAQRERELVRIYSDELAADVLLLGHHGSNTSSTHAWLKRVKPKLAIASAGFVNRFSHPHPAVVARLEQYRVDLLNTAQEGAIRVRIDVDESIKITRWRQLKWRYWY